MEVLSRRDPNEFKRIAIKVGNKLKSFGRMKRHAKSDDDIKKLDKESNDLREYKQLIESYPKKIKPPKYGRGVFYYNNPRDLFERLELLGGSIRAGNNSVKNEFSEVAHTLHKLGALPSSVLNGLLRKFLSV